MMKCVCGKIKMTEYKLSTLSALLFIAMTGGAYASQWICQPPFYKNTPELRAALPKLFPEVQERILNEMRDEYNAWAQCENEHTKFDAEQAHIAFEESQRSKQTAPVATAVQPPQYVCTGGNDVAVLLRGGFRQCISRMCFQWRLAQHTLSSGN